MSKAAREAKTSLLSAGKTLRIGNSEIEEQQYCSKSVSKAIGQGSDL